MAQFTVVFDLDETLISTRDFLLDSLQGILIENDVNCNIKSYPTTKSPWELLGMLMEDGFLIEEKLEAIYRKFLFATKEDSVSKITERMRILVRRLAYKGYVLAICTNKITQHAIALLENNDLISLFKVVCGRDAFRYQKPNPEHLRLTIELAGGEARNSVFIGDSYKDFCAAAWANIPYIDYNSYVFSDVCTLKEIIELYCAIDEMRLCCQK